MQQSAPTGPIVTQRFPTNQTFYGDVFGCDIQLHTFEEFDRTDGPRTAIAHGYLIEGARRALRRLRDQG